MTQFDSSLHFGPCPKKKDTGLAEEGPILSPGAVDSPKRETLGLSLPKGVSKEIKKKQKQKKKQKNTEACYPSPRFLGAEDAAQNHQIPQDPCQLANGTFIVEQVVHGFVLLGCPFRPLVAKEDLTLRFLPGHLSAPFGTVPPFLPSVKPALAVWLWEIALAVNPRWESHPMTTVSLCGKSVVFHSNFSAQVLCASFVYASPERKFLCRKLSVQVSLHKFSVLLCALFARTVLNAKGLSQRQELQNTPVCSHRPHQSPRQSLQRRHVKSQKKFSGFGHRPRQSTSWRAH